MVRCYVVFCSDVFCYGVVWCGVMYWCGVYCNLSVVRERICLSLILKFYLLQDKYSTSITIYRKASRIPAPKNFEPPAAQAMSEHRFSETSISGLFVFLPSELETANQQAPSPSVARFYLLFLYSPQNI